METEIWTCDWCSQELGANRHYYKRQRFCGGLHMTYWRRHYEWGEELSAEEMATKGSDAPPAAPPPVVSKPVRRVTTSHSLRGTNR